MEDDTDTGEFDNGQARATREPAPRASKETVLKRIKLVSQMLISGSTPWEIRDQLSAKWGMSRKSIAKYLAAARKRHRDALEKSATEHLEDALLGWVSNMQEALNAAMEARKGIREQTQRMQQLDARLQEPDLRKTDREQALVDKGLCLEVIAAHRKAHAEAKSVEREIRREIDRLLGNRRPDKVALTTADGKDVNKAASEPVTPEQEDAELQSLIESLKQRGAGMDDAAADGNGRHVGNGSNGRNGKH